MSTSCSENAGCYHVIERNIKTALMYAIKMQTSLRAGLDVWHPLLFVACPAKFD